MTKGRKSELMGQQAVANAFVSLKVTGDGMAKERSGTQEQEQWRRAQPKCIFVSGLGLHLSW